MRHILTVFRSSGSYPVVAGHARVIRIVVHSNWVHFSRVDYLPHWFLVAVLLPLGRMFGGKFLLFRIFLRR